MALADTEQRAFFKRVNELAKAGTPEAALDLLRAALRDGQLGAEALETAGRQIAKLRRTAGTTGVTVRLLGQCTTSWLVPGLTASAWGQGVSLDVSDGEYDNVIQELMAIGPDAPPQVVVLLPWNAHLLHADPRTAGQRIDDEVAFWKQAWQLVSERTGARLIQVGYDWLRPGAGGLHLGGGPGGDIDLVRRANAALRAAMPAGAFFVDLEAISGIYGRSQFYDSRRYFWTKQPFSEAGTAELSRHLFAACRAVLTGPKKVLVLDLDNTLWGGVVGETGPLGIAIGETPDGEAFRAFQRHVKALSERGVLLAASSKNNTDDVTAVFEQNSEMVVRAQDFARMEINWEPKDRSIRRIAAALRLGLDSFVFFDDNPAEREQVRQAIPEVAVVDVPIDPADYVSALSGGLYFEAAAVLESDTARTEQYQAENQRQEAQQSFASMPDYWRSLEMKAALDPIDERNLQRVVQLLGKTNQFNLTTRRHTRDDVLRLLAAPGAVGLTLTMADRFGDYGLVSLAIAVPDETSGARTLKIDTWLMSCRVIGRTTEQCMFNAILNAARDLGYESVTGEYIPTAKNMLVTDLYDRLGFTRVGTDAAGTVSYALDATAAPLAETFVETSLNVHV